MQLSCFLWVLVKPGVRGCSVALIHELTHLPCLAPACSLIRSCGLWFEHFMGWGAIASLFQCLILTIVNNFFLSYLLELPLLQFVCISWPNPVTVSLWKESFFTSLTVYGRKILPLSIYAWHTLSFVSPCMLCEW